MRLGKRSQTPIAAFSESEGSYTKFIPHVWKINLKGILKMNKFESIVKKSECISPLVYNKEKITTEEVKKLYPDGITIVGVDFVAMPSKKDGKPESVPIMIFKEDETAFFFGGTVLSKIISAWISSCDGDIEKTNDELEKCGGVKIKLSDAKTKSGNRITKVFCVSND